jgi:hypothetical protein
MGSREWGKGGTIFRQSLGDFPCPVTLGKSAPSFGLHRFNQALRFVPPVDEGFTLRGDKQRLIYKGRRRSHRFTILGDTAFEYDCILEKPPETNVISLLIEGAEHFDFFRQPDFIKEPLLAGSYAVYKKETFVGEGTGKLCHIHRPEIIDARGRRCWGGLAVVGNELRITIPERWLGEAAYPIIVDPTIGTSTVGSQYNWEVSPGEFETLYFENRIAVNRFYVSEIINGNCTAYFYINEDDTDNGCRPVLYSDNGNSPLTRKSTGEAFVNMRVTSGNPKGWRSGAFKTNGSIAKGSYIWFGASTQYMWYPRFDYGLKCYSDDWYEIGNSLPNTYPIYNVNDYDNFKLSMYFTYTSAQNHVVKITQSVKITDKRKLKADYKRSFKQTAAVKSAFYKCQSFFRQCAMTVFNSVNIGRFPAFYRSVAEKITVTMAFDQWRSLSRNCADDVAAYSDTGRIHNAFRKVFDNLGGVDRQSFSVLFTRFVSDTSMPSDKMRHWGSFIRGLLSVAGSGAETSHKTEYKRFQTDTVQVQGSVFRGLLLFVHIVTKVFIRDYLLGRFLKAREDLILKSAISREITLDSKIS